MSALLDTVIPQSPPLVARVARPLTEGDLVALEGATLGVRPPALQRIRAVHHQLARLLASGMKAVEVSAVTGISQSRISILKDDPAFAQLLAFYSEREDARFEDVQEKMVLLGLDAANELHERLLDSPEEVATRDLIRILEKSLDRGGFAPKTRKEHVHVHLTPADLEKIKQEVGLPSPIRRENRQGAAEGRVIEHLPISAAKADAEGSEGEGGTL